MTVLPTFDMLLFGGTGDLVTRKLLPALYRRFAAGQLSAETRIFGVARSSLSPAAYAAQAEAACREFLGKEFDAQQWQRFAALLSYLKIDAGSEADYAALAPIFKGRDTVIRVFFFSTASNLFSAICQNLAKAHAVTPLSRVVLEKPLGHDSASANLINEQVGAVFAENQIYRIDHYLGKEAVQNLMALRFGNALFEPLWRRGLIKHVQITVAEELGVERRGNFYDKTGAMRDMVQNHLLQLLCIMAMEPPASSAPDAVRDEKLKVLRALRALRDRDVLTKSVRGQYKAGAVRGVPVPGYLDEADIAPDSSTETFVALKVDIDTWRWAGVPFYLRTGKRLQDRLTELVVTFDEVPLPIFEMPSSTRTANKLVIRLQPDESITMTILAKNPGEGMRLKPVSLALDLGETFKTRSLDAYERLLMDTVKGNLTLFMRRDELDAAWAWIDPIREGWERHDERPKQYIAGTWGPASSSAMLSRDGFAWHGEL
ncbi:MAG TPA: glucose-6-phosphate dehydrogenase [Steroidobacteraceae bacterium]|jgi:glucose-6-phosphate 1-dehydrogenase|nr:glucose-6-phosphate dehydrogenase [Steroidobacteraceae bacterium]